MVALRSSRNPGVLRVGAPAPVADDLPGWYALVHLGGADLAIDYYDPAGAWAARVAEATMPNLAGFGSNDSALLIPVDSSGTVAAETAIVTGVRGSLYGVWSWNWRGEITAEYEYEYIGDGLFRPQVQFFGGWLQWQALMDRPSAEAADLIVGTRCRANFTAPTERTVVISGEIDDAPFGLGHCWITASYHRYRYTTTPAGVIVSRWPVSGAPGTTDSDGGFALAQGCADPAGGDFALGGLADLSGAALNRATGAASVADAWSDAVPATAVQALAATVDTAGDVIVPYLLSGGDVQLFHGSPAGAAAETVRTLTPQPDATFLAVSARP